ncbi:MAG: hypothetical protein F6K11_10110 [Leptolyngbya sp. SIO3F4]|nr:hypothetical protein [Leptolyngbya sp. SIO3F4]
MMALDIEREGQQAIALIKAFNLELQHYSPESQVLYWLNQYRAAWIRDAIIEAVYQGRYKIISVQQILLIWKRRGQSTCHFTSGFEKTIASHLGVPIHLPTNLGAASKNTTKNFSPAKSLSQFIPMTETLTQSHSDANNAPEPVQSNRREYCGLAIKAFPVEKFNTLVEVNQAGISDNSSMYQTKIEREPSTVVQDNFTLETIDTSRPLGSTLTQSKVYTSAITSFPIQPFRPTSHAKKSI